MELTVIRQQLSQALSNALGNEGIEAEDIYTFLIYIQLGIIKAVCPSLKKASSKAINLLKYLNEYHELKNTGEKDQSEEIKIIFENNNDILLEIIEDIWNEDVYNAELKWIRTWVAYCKPVIDEIGFNNSFVLLSELAYEQVGVSDAGLASQLLLNSLIKLSKTAVNNSKIIRIS